MKIGHLEPDIAFYGQSRKELEYLLSQPTVKEMRPCPHCTILCPCSGSSTCTCQCSNCCEHAPYQMSSDPERYPIEEKIVPLVYEFYCLRICEPCWSCEGHRSENGALIKIPQVWFYSRALVYPRLIYEHVEELLFKKILTYPWHICVTYSSAERMDTAFSIEPKLNQIQVPQLDTLQEDVERIAVDLVDVIRAKARRYIDEIDSTLETLGKP